MTEKSTTEDKSRGKYYKRIENQFDSFTVEIACCNRKYYSNSFSSRISHLFNYLLAYCFPVSYETLFFFFLNMGHLEELKQDEWSQISFEIMKSKKMKINIRRVSHNPTSTSAIMAGGCLFQYNEPTSVTNLRFFLSLYPFQVGYRNRLLVFVIAHDQKWVDKEN